MHFFPSSPSLPIRQGGEATMRSRLPFRLRVLTRDCALWNDNLITQILLTCRAVPLCRSVTTRGTYR